MLMLPSSERMITYMMNNGLDLCMRCMSRMGENGRCTVCASPKDIPYDSAHLVPGTLLKTRYVVGMATFEDAEGVTYIGYDINAKCKVTVKEYFPREICSRDEYTLEVMPKSGYEAAFKSLMLDFEELNRKLMTLGNMECMIPVIDTFRENDTVYAISRNVNAVILEEALAENGGEMTWAQVKKLFLPVLETLSALHAKGIVHRGISPRTLLVDANGNINISGFCIAEARSAQSEIDASLYAGYSAPEQYQADGLQGSWTDVYSVSAVLYRALSGTRPPESNERKIKDNLIPVAELNAAVPQNVSDAVFEGMLVYTKSRLQTIDQLISGLLSAGGSHTAVFVAQDKTKPKQKEEKKQQTAKAEPNFIQKYARRGMPYGGIACLITMVILIVVGGMILYAQYQRIEEEKGVTISELSDIDIDELAGTISKVPDFVGQYIETVKSNSEYADCFRFAFEYDYNDSFPEGIVYDQSIKKDTALEKNKKLSITLYVSQGSQYEEMPDLVGSTLDYAMKVLDDMGVYYKVMPIASEEGEPGFVLRTNKGEGEKIDTNVDVIILFVKEEVTEEEKPGKGGLSGGVKLETTTDDEEQE
ncbi:MAG: PASTA domain-containing protein [Ruminococcaceae bacterium]|nr:PASTA domain-containing protein [Oscillospiraceae bacterium]